MRYVHRIYIYLYIIMKTERKITKFMSDNTRLKIRIKKKYKRALLKNALLLFLYQIKYNFVNFTANLLFSKKVSKVSKNSKNSNENISAYPGKFLLLTNKILNNTICACHKIFEKCEYYRKKLERL